MKNPGRLFLVAAGSLLLSMAGFPVEATAQRPDSTQALPAAQEEAQPPDSTGPRKITPRGAFIRSSILPGWGHAEVGAYVRGGFYFTVEAASGLMIFKTQTRIQSARRRLELRESVVTGRAARDGITDPVGIEARLADDPEVEDLRALEEVRRAQREDWIALGLFMMLIGGVDAYVSAHLADFPTAVVIDPAPSGGVEIGLSLPWGL